jgi:serine/threonine-protein kinase
MGEVYEAVHVATGERAAVKVLTPTRDNDPMILRRFLRELEIAASLQSPHVTRVLEVAPETAQLPYLAMERLEGESLAEMLRRTPRFEPAQVAGMLRELGRGMAVAHGAGIVHRDIKPSNVFCHHAGGEALWKILDFGVSKLASAGAGVTLTQGHLVGTPAYMAPEQAQGGTVDQRTDVYALGLLAYRTLTGRPAFTGEDIPSMLYAVIHHMPPRPTQTARLPDALDDVLAVAIAKDPDHRFASASDLADAVEAGVRGQVLAGVSERASRALAQHPWGARG